MPAQKATFLAQAYTRWVKTYSSKAECFAEEGCGTRCKGHAARAVKTAGPITHLRCRLRDSTPPCTWSAIVREAPDGSAELLQLPGDEHAFHNDESAPSGERGWDSLQERKSVKALLAATATSKPKVALRAARTSKTAPVQKAQLKQAQKLKVEVVKELYGCRNIGTLREAIRKRQQIPAQCLRGYYCYSSVKTGPSHKKPKITVVATTPLLQQRWVDTPDLVASADGGFKFNLLGWPLHVIGHVNQAGQFGLCALALTSTMEADHVEEMFQGFRDSTIRFTHGNTNKRLAMSDAETAYRRALAKWFGSSNLMCYFHVKQACKEYLEKHFRGAADHKEQVWTAVAADIDLARGAHTYADFQSRCSAVRKKWSRAGVARQTEWVDKEGERRDFVEYFARQWEGIAKEWYVGASSGAIAPSTNNGAESCIKNTRSDAGNVVGSVGETLAFLLSQVESVSRDKWDPEAARKIDESLWRRAVAFSTLFGSPHIRKVPGSSQPTYCCAPRADPSSDDVCSRVDISQSYAEAMVRAFMSQHAGAETSTEELAKFTGPSGARVFGFKGVTAYCSCPAFYHPRRCFHTIGLQIFLGKIEIPDWLDATPLSLAARGNKPRAPGRGAVPLKADEKDLRIARLEATIRKMASQESRSAGKKQGAGSMVALPEPLWTPKRRLHSKTSAEVHMQALSAGLEAGAPPSAPDTVDADERRRLQNALALAANLEMLENDPGVGQNEADLPVKMPHLREELLVAANGRCFTLCCLAAKDPTAWSRVDRKPDGTPARLADLVAEDDNARRFLLSDVLGAGMPGERVGELVLGEYAESKDFVFFAAAMGGAIGVVPPAGQDAQGERFFGNGPLLMQVQLYYLPTDSAPHYKLLQSWA